MRTGKKFIEPLGVDFRAEEIGLGENAPEEGDVGLDAGDGGLFERAAKPCDGFFAAVAPGDEFGEEGIVVVGDGPAVVDTVVEANAGTAGRVAR